jgi:hypothetical protein
MLLALRHGNTSAFKMHDFRAQLPRWFTIFRFSL